MTAQLGQTLAASSSAAVWIVIGMAVLIAVVATRSKRKQP